MNEDTFHNPEALRHAVVHDRDGRLIGGVAEVYVEDWSRRPEWVAVRKEPRVAGAAFVPLAGAHYDTDGNLRIAFTLELVESAPRMHAEQHLGLDQEQLLYVHYGLTPPSDEASGAPGVGEERPKAPVTGQEDALKDIKELAEEPPAGPARLRRFVPTDSVHATVSSSGVHGENR
ncbi:MULTISPECIES: hypothetical protein [unclassified Streptomyces]|uniref:hypothetical protein n=1 Tax=unclassified Streptomyces TaxID=2593676 RepID=UPI002E2E3668|nr:hypothetical protein [Streptomyces sp. NBC_00223]